MEISQQKIKIYQSMHCIYCQKVRLAMELFNIPYQQYEIDLANKENKSEWFAKINQECTVPALVFSDGKIVTDSLSFVKQLDKENNDVLSQRNGENIEAFEIVKNKLGKVFWGYLDARKEVNEKKAKSDDDAYTQLQDVLISLGRECKHENSFFFGDKPSLFDVLYIGDLYQIYLIDKLILKKNIFKCEDEKEQSHLKRLEQYILYASKLEQFQRITYSPPRLPQEGTNFYLKENNITSPKDFDYEEYLKQAIQKKYDNKL